MSILSLQIPPTLQAREHARNICYPDSRFYSELAGALNHGLAFRKKCVFARSNDLGTLATSDDPGTLARFRFLTGHGTYKLALCGLLGKAYDWRGSSPVTNTADPSITISITKVGGSTTITTWHYGGGTTTPTDAPSEWATFYTEIDVDAGAAYTGVITSSDYARFMCITVHELGYRTVDDANLYFTEHDPVAGGPILDGDIQKIIQGPSKMILANGATQVNWNRVLLAARSTSSTTWTNLIDGSSTSPPTSTSPGYRLNTTARNTRSATTVPVTIAVYAEATGSGDGHVTLRNTSGTDEATCDITGGAGATWFTGTGALTVGSTVKLDLGFYAEASTTLDVYAVSIYEDGT